MAERDEHDVLAAAAAALRTAPVDIPEPLTIATSALREVGAASSPDAAATRGRIMASLERREPGRRKRVIVAAVMATLGTGTLSWAAATGRIERVLEVIAEPSLPPGAEPTPVVVAAEAGRRRRARAVEVEVEQPAPVVEPAPIPVIEPVPAPVPIEQATTAPDPIPVPDAPFEPLALPVPEVAPPRPARRARPPKVAVREPRVTIHPSAEREDTTDQQLYRRAHDAHFRGDDPAAALLAWDIYLGERPAGRFAIEARYNRALVLIRLDRIDDALAALAPFAEGTVEPVGYRQPDARALIDALDHTASR